MMTYWTIEHGENGLRIRRFEDDVALRAELEQREAAGEELNFNRNMPPLTHGGTALQRDPSYWGSFFAIIKGEVVVPKARQVRKIWEID